MLAESFRQAVSTAAAIFACGVILVFIVVVTVAGLQSYWEAKRH